MKYEIETYEDTARNERGELRWVGEVWADDDADAPVHVDAWYATEDEARAASRVWVRNRVRERRMRRRSVGHAICLIWIEAKRPRAEIFVRKARRGDYDEALSFARIHDRDVVVVHAKHADPISKARLVLINRMAEESARSLPF